MRNKYHYLMALWYLHLARRQPIANATWERNMLKSIWHGKQIKP